MKTKGSVRCSFLHVVAYVLVTGLMITGVSDPAAAQTLPPGSYKQSCANPSVSGTTLGATCASGEGSQIYSELHNIDQCLGDIANYNGVLTCQKDMAAVPGSYLESCINIAATPVGSSATLHALCKRRDGAWSKTSLPHYDDCRGDIANDHGQLICTGWR